VKLTRLVCGNTGNIPSQPLSDRIYHDLTTVIMKKCLNTFRGRNLISKNHRNVKELHFSENGVLDEHPKP